jgi:peptidoglycan/LPS O-acetylase OafA/YrhL
MLHSGGETGELAQAIGRFGVIVFFFHTSFVLQQSLDSPDQGTALWALRFYLRRAFRIYPLAIVVILAALACRVPFAPWDLNWTPPRNLVTVFANLTLTQNLIGASPVIGPLWSLPLEVQMYALLPLIFVLMAKSRWKAYQAALWAVASAAALALYSRTGHLNLLAFVPCFLSGVLSYKLAGSWSPRWNPGVWILAIAAVSVIGFRFTLNIPMEWAACLALALIFPAVRDSRARWLTVPAHYVAQYSYGIYLFHVFALWIGFRVSRVPAMQVSLSIAITAILSVAAFHYVEQPLIQAGKSVAKRLSRPVAFAATAAGR